MYRNFLDDVFNPGNNGIPEISFPPCEFDGKVELVSFTYRPISGPTGPYQSYLLQWEVKGPETGWSLELVKSEGRPLSDPAPLIGSHIVTPNQIGTYVLKARICSHEQSLGLIRIEQDMSTCVLSEAEQMIGHMRDLFISQIPLSLSGGGIYSRPLFIQFPVAENVQVVPVLYAANILDLKVTIDLVTAEADSPVFRASWQMGFDVRRSWNSPFLPAIAAVVRSVDVRILEYGDPDNIDFAEVMRYSLMNDLYRIITNIVYGSSLNQPRHDNKVLQSVQLVAHPENAYNLILKRWYCPKPKYKNVDIPVAPPRPTRR